MLIKSVLDKKPIWGKNCFFADNATLIGDVVIGDYSSIWFNTVIRGDVNKNDRQGGIFKSWGYVFTNHLKGEYVEFGVYRGEGTVSSLKSYQNFYLRLLH